MKTSHDSYATAALRLPLALQGFCETVLKMTPGELLHHLEAYAVQGPSGVATSSRKVHDAMKKEVTSGLLRNLREYTTILT